MGLQFGEVHDAGEHKVHEVLQGKHGIYYLNRRATVTQKKVFGKVHRQRI